MLSIIACSLVSSLKEEKITEQAVIQEHNYATNGHEWGCLLKMFFAGEARQDVLAEKSLEGTNRRV